METLKWIIASILIIVGAPFTATMVMISGDDDE